MLMGCNGSMVSGGVFWKQMAETEFVVRGGREAKARLRRGRNGLMESSETSVIPMGD